MKRNEMEKIAKLPPTYDLPSLIHSLFGPSEYHPTRNRKNNSTTRLFVAADKSRTFTVLSSSFENISQLSVGFGERIEMQYNYDGHVK